MNINELVEQVHQNAKDHGWWDEPRSMAELLCLIHSEVSEALEEDRSNRKPNETYYSAKFKMPKMFENTGVYTVPEGITDDIKRTICATSKNRKPGIDKPEGIPSELADVVIRVMDICGYYGIDLESAIAEKMEYNKTRPMKHGGKKL